MNFCDGVVHAANGTPVLRVADHAVTLPAWLPRGLEARRLMLGIRPQDVALAAADDPHALPGRVWMVELTGSERLVEVEIAPKLRITAEVRSEINPPLDSPSAVAFPPGRLHLFDPETGKALPRAA
jgi:hypothetical protein